MKTETSRNKASCPELICFVEDAKDDKDLLHGFYKIFSHPKWEPGFDNDALLKYLHDNGYKAVDEDDLEDLDRLHKYLMEFGSASLNLKY